MTRTLILIAAFSVVPLAALAHGVAKHGTKPAAQPIVATDFGRTGDPKKISRTIRIDMADTMRFTPAALEINQGETVRFVVKNSGKQMHEMVLGTMKELKEHAEMMRKHPGMEHDEPYMAHVAPGKSEEIVWQFTKPGEFQYGCLVPGHFEAGMVGRITVAGAASVVSSTVQPPSEAARQQRVQQVAQAQTLANGEVRKVDKEAKKITIKHGPLPELDMPAMTMVFQVKDPAMLDQVVAGDKIQFKAEKLGGAFTVTRIERGEGGEIR
jgi:uncharacterized cupredoxin-like copper-binding protein/Cu/Ag efflux protein CusF